MSNKKVDLNSQEQSIIESALNHYWNDANTQLTENCKYALDGTKLPLGDIEKVMLKKRMELVEPLLRKFENL